MPELIGDIATWVATRLKRQDVAATTIENAKNFYKLLCSAVPFDELETTSAERAMVSGTGSYDLSDLQLNGICSIRLTYGTNQFRRLRRSHPRVYDSLGSVVPGIPATYARWGKAIEVNPTPGSSSYTYRLRYWRAPAIETTPENTTIILEDPWLELIRYETLYRTYLDYEEFEKANMLVAPMPMPRQGQHARVFEYGIIPKLWNDLLKTIRQRENVDEDFSINPVVRKYTN